MRAVLTGGGTGGHIYPALAICQEIVTQQPDSELMYIGSKRGIEGKIVSEQGISFQNISINGFRRSFSWHNVKTIFRFMEAVKYSKELLHEFKPDIVIGTGGYVCGPVIFAATKLGIPSMIHEQNLIPGLTNKFLARYADEVLVSFKESLPFFMEKKARVICTGNPTASRVAKAKAQNGFAFLGLQKGTPFVLIVGGSGGAQALNDAFIKMLPLIEQLPDVYFVFITGERFYTEAMEAIKQQDKRTMNRVIILAYVSDMPSVLAAATLYVGRSGASFLAEITALGLPSLLIPSPNVTNNHQEANARNLLNEGAANMILEQHLTGLSLFTSIAAFIRNPSVGKSMRNAALRIGNPHAATKVYQEIVQLIHKR